MKNLQKKLIAGVMGAALVLGGFASNAGFAYAEYDQELKKGIKEHHQIVKRIKQQLRENDNLKDFVNIVEESEKIAEILKRIDNERKPQDERYVDVNEFEEKLGLINEDGLYAVAIEGRLIFLEIKNINLYKLKKLEGMEVLQGPISRVEAEKVSHEALQDLIDFNNIHSFKEKLERYLKVKKGVWVIGIGENYFVIKIN